jgi:hypothetical protein
VGGFQFLTKNSWIYTRSESARALAGVGAIMRLIGRIGGV